MKTSRLTFILVAGLLTVLAGGLALPAIELSSRPAPAPLYTHLSIGGGYGLNYGGIGFNFEFNPKLPARFGQSIHNYASLGLGVGYLPDGGLAYLFGLHLYPLGRKMILQPRLNIAYGVVAITSDLYSYPGDERRTEGVALGAGLLVKFNRNLSLDGDMYLILPVDYDIDELQGGRVRISAGLRWHL